jgi:hypothetical protein
VADVTPSPADEARHLHACLFRKPLDAVVIARYEAALQVGHALACSGEVVSTVVARRLDAEAVEFALRRRGLGCELARRMQILCYLVEVRPDYLSAFVNLEPLYSTPAGASFAPHGTARVSKRTTATSKAIPRESRPQAGEADGTVCPTSEITSKRTTGVVVAQGVSPTTSASATAVWAALLSATLRSGWKLLKGEYLVRRHGLV